MTQTRPTSSLFFPGGKSLAERASHLLVGMSRKKVWGSCLGAGGLPRGAPAFWRSLLAQRLNCTSAAHLATFWGLRVNIKAPFTSQAADMGHRALRASAKQHWVENLLTGSRYQMLPSDCGKSYKRSNPRAVQTWVFLQEKEARGKVLGQRTRR